MRDDVFMFLFAKGIKFKHTENYWTQLLKHLLNVKSALWPRCFISIKVTLTLPALVACRELKEILDFRNHQTCMKEAALLDFYVCGFWWAKEANFTPMQTSFTMAVLHMLLGNIKGGEDTKKEGSRQSNSLVLFSVNTHCHTTPPLIFPEARTNHPFLCLLMS